MFTGKEIGKDNVAAVDLDDQCRNCGSSSAVAHPQASALGALFCSAQPTNKIRKLSLFRLTTCSFRDGTLDTAVPGRNGGHGGVKSCCTCSVRNSQHACTYDPSSDF